MDGRHGDTSEPDSIVRRLRDWFETLPFNRGISYLGIAVAVPAAVISGSFVLGGGANHAVAPPRAQARQSVTTQPSVRSERTWGAYVPPRKVRPSPTMRRSTPTVRPTPKRASKRSGNGCPPEFKKWRWMWEICRRNADGHMRR